MHMFELEQLRVRETFRDIMTVRLLMDETGLSKTAIMNAIYAKRLIAEKRDAAEFERGGVWLISRKSAQKLWQGRFTRKAKQRAN